MKKLLILSLFLLLSTNCFAVSYYQNINIDSLALIAEDNTFTGTNTFNSGITTTSLDSSGIITTNTLILNGAQSFSITSANDTVTVSASYIDITSDAEYLMTGTPSITTANMSNGRILIMYNNGSNSITFQDKTVINSGVAIGGTSGSLSPGDTATMLYNSNTSCWSISSISQGLASVNVNASSALPVRNVSGTSLSSGDAVYVTGYNAGQARVTVAKADADDSAKMPAIGIVIGSIPNNSNGSVVLSGEVSNFNTSSWSIGDPLYVSTNAGSLTNIRPTSGDIQKIAEVVRSHATLGRVLVIGAGRTNDTPLEATFNALSVNADADVTVIAGRVKLSPTTSAGSDRAVFGHYDLDTSSYALAQTSDGITVVNAHASKYIQFGIGSSGKAAITNGGNLVVGKTTSSGSAKLQVEGDVSANGIITGTTLSTGQGQYELYAMDQDVLTTSEVTFATANITNDINTVAEYDYSATSTIVGFSSVSSKEIYVKKVGNYVFVQFAIEGTSNSTNFTFTLPYNAKRTLVAMCVQAIDNGAWIDTTGDILITAGSNVATVERTASDATWTASNNKKGSGQFSYEAE